MPSILLFVSALAIQAPAVAPASDAVAEAYFLFLQSRTLEQAGNVNGAISALRKASALLPKSAEIQAELAAVYFRDGRANESVMAAEAALSIDGKNREAHRTLGLLQATVAEIPEYASTAEVMRSKAIAHLEQALAVPMSDLMAQFTLSQLYVRTKQPDKAVPVLKAFVAEQPNYPAAWLLLGEAAESTNKWEDAVTAWGQINAMDTRGRYRPRYATALVKLGDHYFGLKRYREAADAFDRALASDKSAIDAAGVTQKRDRARELAGK
jgi:tetratricopeptide (TPR) repeat protein